MSSGLCAGMFLFGQWRNFFTSIVVWCGWIRRHRFDDVSCVDVVCYVWKIFSCDWTLGMDWGIWIKKYCIEFWKIKTRWVECEVCLSNLRCNLGGVFRCVQASLNRPCPYIGLLVGPLVGWLVSTCWDLVCYHVAYLSLYICDHGWLIAMMLDQK